MEGNQYFDQLVNQVGQSKAGGVPEDLGIGIYIYVYTVVGRVQHTRDSTFCCTLQFTSLLLNNEECFEIEFCYLISECTAIWGGRISHSECWCHTHQNFRF